MRFVGGRTTPHDELERDFIPAYLRYYQRGNRYGFWAAIEKSSGNFLGWFHFRPLEGAGPDEPELGYRLRKAVWGRGYATEGSRALVRKGFTELGIGRVVASAFADNVASRRVLEKAGLTLVRTYHHSSPDLGDGEAVEYALENASWECQEQTAPRFGAPSQADAGWLTALYCPGPLRDQDFPPRLVVREIKHDSEVGFSTGSSSGPRARLLLRALQAEAGRRVHP